MSASDLILTDPLIHCLAIGFALGLGFAVAMGLVKLLAVLAVVLWAVLETVPRRVVAWIERQISHYQTRHTRPAVMQVWRSATHSRTRLRITKVGGLVVTMVAWDRDGPARTDMADAFVRKAEQASIEGWDRLVRKERLYLVCR